MKFKYGFKWLNVLEDLLILLLIVFVVALLLGVAWLGYNFTNWFFGIGLVLLLSLYVRWRYIKKEEKK